MRINRINPQPSCKAVNQKYFEWAKKNITLCGGVSTEWLNRLQYDVFLFKEVSKTDAVDTINALKKEMQYSSSGMDAVLGYLENSN